LENAVERALVIRRAQRIEVPDFPFQMSEAPRNNGQSLDEVERAHVEHVVKETGGNLSQAARILHIDRTTLYNKLRKYHLR
jgi:two-component system response regulator HydG